MLTELFYNFLHFTLTIEQTDSVSFTLLKAIVLDVSFEQQNIAT